MLSDIFSFLFTLFLPNWLLISIRIYSGIARFPCDSMAFLFVHAPCVLTQQVQCFIQVHINTYRRENSDDTSVDGTLNMQSRMHKLLYFRQFSVISTILGATIVPSGDEILNLSDSIKTSPVLKI